MAQVMCIYSHKPVFIYKLNEFMKYWNSCTGWQAFSFWNMFWFVSSYVCGTQFLLLFQNIKQDILALNKKISFLLYQANIKLIFQYFRNDMAKFDLTHFVNIEITILVTFITIYVSICDVLHFAINFTVCLSSLLSW